MSQRASLVVISLAILLGTSALASADTVLFKDGRKLEGEVEVVGTKCQIKLKFGGTYVVEMSEVKKVIYGNAAPREKKKKKKKKKRPEEPKGEPEREDPPKAEPSGDASGEAHGDAAASEPAVAELEPGELPSPDAAERTKLLEHCPDAKITETKHYVVISTAGEDFTRDAGKMLETVRRGFYKFFQKKGFETVYHRKKLVAYVFGSREEYSAYNGRSGLGVTSRAAGFYHTRTNALYFSDARNSPTVRRVKESIKKFEDSLEEIKKKRREAERAGDRRFASMLSKHLKDESRRLRKFKQENRKHLEESNDEITIHEATHQLTYNAAILVPSDLNPEWVVEGLAMLFEDPGVWKGRYVKGANQRRKEDLKRAADKGRRMTVRDLVGSNRTLISRGDPSLAYGSAWALIHMFVRGRFKKYKEPFLTYLKGVQKRAQTAGWKVRGEEAANERLEAFEEAFGKVDRLEGDYKKYVDKLIADVEDD